MGECVLDRLSSTYILHGRAYHAIGSLYPAAGKKYKYAQLYIYDPIEATALRTGFRKLRPRDAVDTPAYAD